MHLFFSFELVRVVFLIGLIVSLLTRKRFGLNPGGIIVPAYLAIILDQSWLWFAVLIMLSGLNIAVYRLFVKHRALPVRSTAMILTIVSVVSVIAAAEILKALGWFNLGSVNALLGSVIPALISISSIKITLKRTFIAMFSATVITYLLGGLLAWAMRHVDLSSITWYDQLVRRHDTGEISVTYFDLILSAAVAAVAHFWRNLRIGGFVILPYIASIAMNRPQDFVVFLAITVLTYVVVLKVISEFTLLYGVTRFITLAGVAMVFIWLYEYIAVTGWGYLPFYGSALLIPVAVAVWANDAVLQGLRKTAYAFPLALIIAISGAYLASQMF